MWPLTYIYKYVALFTVQSQKNIGNASIRGIAGIGDILVAAKSSFVISPLAPSSLTEFVPQGAFKLQVYNNVMDKKLREHSRFMKSEIEKFRHKINNTKTPQETKLLARKIRELQRYHEKTVRNFQHERSIHLAVTLFFAGLLLLSVAALFAFAISPVTSDLVFINTLIQLVSLILLVLELFYIKHYFSLENGTQKLYQYSKILFEILCDLS